MKPVSNLNVDRERLHDTCMLPLDVRQEHLKDQVQPHHWHKEIEFIVLKEGEASVQINSEIYNIASGQGIIVNSGLIHNCCPAGKSIPSINFIKFDLNMLNSSTDDMLQKKYFNSIIHNSSRLPELLDGNSQWSSDVLNCINDIISIFNKKDAGYELYIKALLLKILYIFISNNKLKQVDSIRSKDHRDIKKVLNYIWNNYKEEIELTKLAELTNLSKYHFCRLFKSHIGISPIDYLNSYRIYKAAKLLEETKKQISEIASDVGFDNTSYFIRTFKRYKNCTPSCFRKSQLDN